MSKALRRRLRARALGALVHAGGFVPSRLVRGTLTAASPIARFTRYERRTLANLELALGHETDEAERRRIASGVRRHAARLFAEWLKLARGGDGTWIDRAVTLDPSIEVLRRELARGRGALIVTAHLGNWELLCARLRRLGLDGAVVGYERPRDESARWLAAMRRAYGVQTLSQQTSAREILRVLQGGLVVGLLADLEDRRIDGEFLPFFGVPALTMTAVAAADRRRAALRRRSRLPAARAGAVRRLPAASGRPRAR
jgi:KDO2-lipid IV(A) lauroyltransferase